MSPTTQALLQKYQALIKEQGLSKAYMVATGLQPVDLQTPAKNLYSVWTPLRNSLPRVSGGIGVSTQWKEVSAITPSGNRAQPWVAEGQRTARMSITTANKSALYRTLGEEDQASFEAISAGRGFEDIQAGMVDRLMQAVAIKEEDAILFGNASLDLATTPTPTLAATGTGATLPTLTYDVVCVALTGEGYRNFSLTSGLTASNVITGADGLTYTLKGGFAQKSAIAQQAITLGQHLDCTVAAVRGAVAYAWYVGGAAAAKLERITTVNHTRFSAPLAGTGQAASALPSSDSSSNVDLAWDGLLTAALKSTSGAYYFAMASGSAGVGSALTATDRGSIAEVDDMLYSMFSTNLIGVDVIYVNAQEQKNMTAKVLKASGGSPLLQISKSPNEPLAIVANGSLEYYWNPFTTGGGKKVPVVIHPTLPAGTILARAETLPPQYANNNVPRVAEIRTRVDFYQLDWPIRTRQREVGVYVEEALPIYMPAAAGVITNIGNA